MPYDLFGNLIGAPGKTPAIDLGFTGLYPGAGGGSTLAPPKPQPKGLPFGDFEPKAFTPYTPPEEDEPNEPEPDADKDDWQIQPRQNPDLHPHAQEARANAGNPEFKPRNPIAAAALAEARAPKMQALWTRDEAGGLERKPPPGYSSIDPATGEPRTFTTREEAREIQARMAGVPVEQLPPSVEQRKYGTEYDANKGPNDMANVILRARQGDKGASNVLWEASGRDRTAYVRAIQTGKLPYQLEDEARQAAADAALEERTFRIGMAERGMSLEEQKAAWANERDKVAQAYKVEKDRLDRDLAERRIGIEEYNSRTSRLGEEARNELLKRQNALQENSPERKLAEYKLKALQEADAATPAGQMNPVRAGLLGLPSANKQESEALDLDLKRAQVAAAQQAISDQASGQMSPMQKTQAIRNAGIEAQQMADEATPAEDIQARLSAKYNIKPEEVPLPRTSTDPRYLQQYAEKLGGQGATPEAAFKAAAAQVAKQTYSAWEDAKARTGAGSLTPWNLVPGTGSVVALGKMLSTNYQDSPEWRQQHAGEIVNELVLRGWPKAAAAKVVAQHAR